MKTFKITYTDGSNGPEILYGYSAELVEKRLFFMGYWNVIVEEIIA